MSHYRSDVRDVEFNLFEVFDAGGYYGTGPFEAVDASQARMLIAEFERFCRESSWAGSFAAADREDLLLSPDWCSRSAPGRDAASPIPAPCRRALRALHFSFSLGRPAWR